MTSRVFPRSASDATRFTSTTPHAASKHSPTPFSAKAAAEASPRTFPTLHMPGKQPGETPEERVRRLRAAHEAARRAQASGVDKVIGSSRKVFDFAHKLTVLGLIGFTALAGVVSIYSVYDMVTYNKQRRADFFEAQRKIEEDSLAAARLAFINGTATDDQVTLVEEANARARETGVKLPPLLSAPTVTTQAEKFFGNGQQNQQQQHTQQNTQAPETTAFSFFSTTSEAAEAEAATDAKEPSRSSSWWPRFSHNAVEDPKDSLQDKAKAAFERERENQRRGGSLDRLGLPAAAEEKRVEKKGWW